MPAVYYTGRKKTPPAGSLSAQQTQYTGEGTRTSTYTYSTSPTTSTGISPPKEYGGSIGSVIPGSTITTQPTQQTTGGIRASSLPGSVGSSQAVELQQQALRERQQGDYERAAILQSQADYILMSDQQKKRAEILAKPTPSGYQTIGGRTRTLVNAQPQPFIAASPGFAGKAATLGEVDVRILQAPSRVGVSLKQSYTPTTPEMQVPFFYKPPVTETRITPTEIVTTQIFEPRKELFPKEYGGEIKRIPPTVKEYGGELKSAKWSVLGQFRKGYRETKDVAKAYGKLAWATAKGFPKLLSYAGTSQSYNLAGTPESQKLIELPESKAALYTTGAVASELLPGVTSTIAQGILVPKAVSSAQEAAYGKETVTLAREAQQRAVESLEAKPWTLYTAPQKVLSFITPAATGVEAVKSQARIIGEEKEMSPEQITKLVQETKEITGTGLGAEFGSLVNVERNVERLGQRWIGKKFEQYTLKQGGKTLSRKETLAVTEKLSRLPFKVLGATEGGLQYYAVQEIRGQPKTVPGFALSMAGGALASKFFGVPTLQKKINPYKGTVREVEGLALDFPQESLGDVLAGKSPTQATITRVGKPYSKTERFVLGVAKEGGAKVRVSTVSVGVAIPSVTSSAKIPGKTVTSFKSPSSITTSFKNPVKSTSKTPVPTYTKTPVTDVTKTPIPITTKTKTPVTTTTKTPIKDITKVPFNTKFPTKTTSIVTTISTTAKFPFLKLPSRTAGDQGFKTGGKYGYGFKREYKIKTPSQFYQILTGKKKKAGLGF